MNEELIKKMLLALSLQTGGNYEQMFRLLQRKEFPPMEDILNAEKHIKSRYLTFFDKEYPDSLRESARPPLVIYYYGDISLLYKEKEAVAVIGSREASEEGISVTEEFVRELVPDYLIVSGLAKGIDATAHRAALDNDGKTIAVLGSGIDYCYPSENYSLYRKIKEKGLVISEYPNATVPEQDNFPMRNRIIAGLAKGILITEAKKRSGTLITVNWAQMLSKEVMCVPYRARDNSGCNQLIKDGAYLVEDSEDVRLVMDGTRKLKKTLMPY